MAIPTVSPICKAMINATEEVGEIVVKNYEGGVILFLVEVTCLFTGTRKATALNNRTL
jgi:hypothetical protein